MQTGEVILRLARELGAPLAQAFPWPSYREAVLARLAALPGKPEEALAALEARGVWRYPSGRMRRSDGEEDSQRPGSSVEKARLCDLTRALSSLQKPTFGDPVRFPYVLVPYRGPGYAEGGTRHFPWLGELPLSSGDPWLARVELALPDAQSLGIESGDRVVVESAVARVELLAQVRPGIRPGVLALPLGGGPRMVKPGIAMASNLLCNLVDSGTGLWLAHATLAQIRKAS
jgi:anaerobic selenocysteine-containing dehydrogenase